MVSSPHYNIGKVCEMRSTLEVYLKWQKRIIKQMIPHLKDTASICWQVGNFVDNGQISRLILSSTPSSRSISCRCVSTLLAFFACS
ncbi:hypothetical protein [Candidatus Methylobacter favarea]|uniref:hypothetical protein n=1 Tax=Candidatus Methylobacter favarea TaxID=2707345 RepID=UPI00157D752F